MKLEKLTKLPEDVLEAVSAARPVDRKQRDSKSKLSKPADADKGTEDARLADDESELHILQSCLISLLVEYCSLLDALAYVI